VNKQKQSGFSHIMIFTVIVTVALVGTLGFVYWQNFLQPKTTTKTNSSASVASSTTPKVTDPYDGWKTYTDTTAGFSFRYPKEFTIFDGEKNPTWTDQAAPNHLTVNVSEVSQGADYADVSLSGSNTSDVVAAINGLGTFTVSGLPKADVTVKKIGSTNFMRIFPGLGEGCFCKTISYITVVGDNFVEISSHTRGADPQTGTPDVMDDNTFNSRFSSDKDSLIVDLYGNVESILATFNKL
jgi:hypothetical protein